MRALGTLAAPAGIDPLLRIFREPRHELRPQVDNLVYAARMLSNIPAAAPRLMTLVAGEFAEDTERRYRCLATLARIAGLERVGEEQRRRITEFLLDYLADEEQDPRDRIVLCRLLLPFLGLDEVMRLKRIMLRTPDPRVKRGINSFLWAFFGRPGK
jgi:hypothetical protein